MVRGVGLGDVENAGGGGGAGEWCCGAGKWLLEP